MSTTETPIEYDRRTGDVTIHAADRTVRLPYPNFGQFRKAIELDQARADADRAALTAFQETTPDATLSTEFLMEARARTLQWWVDVAAMLAVVDFPAIDELPPWMTMVDSVGKTIDHWLMFPFVDPGVPAGPGTPPAAAET